MRLFTIDIETEGLIEKHDNYFDKSIQEKKKHRDREKAKLSSQLLQGALTSWDIYAQDQDFKEMRRNYNKHFAKKFSEGYQKYLKGDWATAEDIFAQCLRMKPKDGPTITLKAFIEQHNGSAPISWQGFRELTDK